MRGFAEQARHEGVTPWVVGTSFHVAINFRLGLLLAPSQRKFQKVSGSPLLRLLLVQDVLQQVFVPLDKPLAVNLSMLYLLLAIALDTLQQRLEGKRLLFGEVLLLAVQCLSHFLLEVGVFKRLQFVDAAAHFLGVVVLLDREVDLLLLPERDQVFTWIEFELAFNSFGQQKDFLALLRL